MEIQPKTVVALTYELFINDFDGEKIEEATENQPLVFIFGIGNMIPDFEKNIQGLKPGDSFKFMIPADNAYGQASDENIVDIPIDAFTINGKIPEDLLQVGNYIPIRDTAGNEYIGKVTKIGLDKVQMDFNHPLAGKDLYFTGKIISVRDATEEELNAGEPMQA